MSVMKDGWIEKFIWRHNIYLDHRFCSHQISRCLRHCRLLSPAEEFLGLDDFKDWRRDEFGEFLVAGMDFRQHFAGINFQRGVVVVRSEERRVGKEGRSRW